MIKYSWEKINNKFGWNPYDVLNYFYLKNNLKPPSFIGKKPTKKVIQESKKSYPLGNCYLINVKKLLIEADSPNHIYNYLDLASMRNVFDYSIRGINSLPSIIVPQYLRGWIEVNPYLEERNHNIYFKFEQE